MAFKRSSVRSRSAPPEYLAKQAMTGFSVYYHRKCDTKRDTHREVMCIIFAEETRDIGSTFRLPKDVQQHFPSRYIRKSLKTNELRSAKLLVKTGSCLIRGIPDAFGGRLPIEIFQIRTRFQPDIRGKMKRRGPRKGAPSSEKCYRQRTYWPRGASGAGAP